MKVFIKSKRYLGFASVAFMLLVWKIVAIYYSSDLILPHPEKTLLTTLKLIASNDFMLTIGVTTLRGLVGFFISLALGTILGILAGVNEGFYSFLRPILVTFRSTPVIAITLLALIWLSNNSVPIFIAIITMFPFICTNIIDGIRSVDPQLVEMSRIYKISSLRVITLIYIPAILPFIFSGASSAMGIGWRAIIIGEVLSQPKFGIGTIMHSAQTFLNVDDVIAWTIIAVLISYIFEKAIRLVEKKVIKWR